MGSSVLEGSRVRVNVAVTGLVICAETGRGRACLLCVSVKLFPSSDTHEWPFGVASSILTIGPSIIELGGESEPVHCLCTCLSGKISEIGVQRQWTGSTCDSRASSCSPPCLPAPSPKHNASSAARAASP